ncbi:MAG: hypothetical protein K6G37_00095, partial [Bacilli bacterium]|nr:hypothetical protein [Bacilli bacterium]
MNVIVSNKNQDLLANLDIDLIKSINGEFTPEEISAQFPSNFYYNKMVLDITAIRNFENISVIQDLAQLLDMSKVVLFLNDSEVVNSPTYLSQLVSMGIYNFTKTIDAVKFLIDNPNTYKDVASYHQLNNVASKPFSASRGMDQVEDSRLRVIGFKNVTAGAGATTLVYMLKKQLEKLYGVIAVEVDKNDFIYLNDKSLQRTDDLASFINSNQRSEVILVDLNEFDGEELCTDVVYLIEPGLIQLNKLIRKDSSIFERLRGKKIVLNRSVLNSKDVSDFENESNSKIFFNIPNLDDKQEFHKVLEDFLP